MAKKIPFIHNYCDRWCERCAFTARCAVFESEQLDTEEEKDISNPAFFNKLQRNLENTINLLKLHAIEHGIDLDNIPEEEMKDIELAEKAIDQMTEEDPIISLSGEYISIARCIMEDEPLWKRKADELIGKDEMGLTTRTELIDELNTLKECKEVIGWYLYFIQIKFKRAISGLLDKWEEESEVQTDFNGSAKIALIAIERSRYAWTQLFDLMPQDDHILTALSLLDRLEKMAREKFPRLEEFVRPGFDECSYAVQSKDVVLKR